jgi:hypothetical protein
MKIRRGQLPRIVAVIAVCACSIAAAAAPSAPGDASLNFDPRYSPTAPQAQSGTGDDRGVYLPPLAGPSSEIVGTVLPDDGTGPAAFYVGAVDGNGGKHYWKGATDSQGHFHFRVPVLASGVAALLLFKHFDSHGQPDRGSSCQVADKPALARLPDAQPVIGYPAHGPAILEANTAFERGGFSQGIMQLHTRDLDPTNAHVLIDGRDAEVDTLAASDSSIVGKLHDNASLGRRVISARSGNLHTNGLNADIIAISFTPLPPLKPGVIAPLGLHVEGLGKDPAFARFDVTGAASLADGSSSARVPIVDGQCEVNIRGQRAGQLQVRVTIDVQMPLVALNAETEPRPSILPTTTSRPPGVHYTPSPTPAHTGPPKTTGRENETPPPLLSTGRPPTEPPPSHPPTTVPSATPTEYPPTHPPSPSPTPTPCDVKITDGWMEPAQGVWQDDLIFDDHPTKQITRTSRPGDPPSYKAELDMIVDRDTLLFGVEHYRYRENRVEAGTHSIIHMAGTTDCSDPPKGVSMQFTLEEGPLGRILWTSGEVAQIKLTGHRTTEEPWEADLTAHGDGVPPPDVGPFKIDAQGPYAIKDELITGDGQGTGLILTVGGNAHLVSPIKIAYIPLILTPVVGADALALENASDDLGTQAGMFIPDYYPVYPHWIEGWAYDPLDLSNTNVLNPTIEKVTWPGITQKDIDFHDQYNRADKVTAELARRFAVLARESGYDRFVVTVSAHDMNILQGPYTLGAAVDQKFVLVMQGQSFLVEAHELAHTLPYIWSSGQMAKQCKKPGDYHNKAVHWANGYRIDTNNAPGPRKDEDATYPFFGETSPVDSVWNDQCTYWNLARTLIKHPDPAVMLVRGVAVKHSESGRFGGFLWPAYTLNGVPDLESRRPSGVEHWSIELDDASGKALAAYPFEPQWYDENGRRRGLVAFAYEIPTNVHAAALVLRGPDAVNWRVPMSTTPPSVRITEPSANAQLGSPSDVTVTWTESGDLRTPLLATVLYSPDGNRWYDQIFEEPVTRATVRLKKSSKHWIKVIVTDGTRSATSSITFTTRGAPVATPNH